MLFNLDIAIVLAFLLITLAVGIYYGRGISNLKEYALGNRRFSTSTITSTLVATWISGSAFSIILSKTYSDGLYYIIPSAGIIVSFLIVGYVIAPHTERFLGYSSVADLLGNFYGDKVKIITAIAGFVGTIGLVAVQFKVAASLFTHFLGLSYFNSLILASSVVIFYAAFGGLKSVTFTDVIQLFAFAIFIPIMGHVIWHSKEDSLGVMNMISHNSLFDYKNIFNYQNPRFFDVLFLFLYFCIPKTAPALFQRISMASSPKQVKKSFVNAAMILLCIELLIIWIGILLLSINSTLNPTNLVSHLIDNYSYLGLKGFIIVGIMAMVMSTADSHINSSSILLTETLLSFKKLSTQAALNVTRIFAVFLGIFSICLSFLEKDLFKIILTANSFYMPIVTVPLLFTILGFSSFTKPVLIGIFAGFITVISSFIFDYKFNIIIPAMFANLLFWSVSHYFLKKYNYCETHTQNNTGQLFQSIDLNLRIKNSISHIKNFDLLAFFRSQTPKNESTYFFVGFFCIALIYSTMYTISSEVRDKYTHLFDFMYYSTLIISSSFLAYSIWPPYFRNKNFVAIFWVVGLFYVLVFISCLQVVLSNLSQFQLMIFIIGTIILSSLLKWQTSLFLIITGIFSGLKFISWYTAINIVSSNFMTVQFKIIYLVLFMSAIFIFLFKPKQKYLEKTEEQADYFKDQAEKYKGTTKHFSDESEKFLKAKKILEKKLEKKSGDLKDTEKYLKEKLKLMHIEVETVQEMKNEFIRNVPHESNTPMTAVLSLSEVLHSCYDKLDEGDIKQSLKGIVRGGERLKSYVNNIADLSKLSSLSYKLNIQPINLTTLVKQRPNLYTKIFADDKKQEFIFNIKEDIIIRCDEYYLTQAIDNLIGNAVQYGKGKPVTITLEQVPSEKNELAVEKVKFEIKDQGIGIPETELVNIFDTFTVSSKTKSIAGGRGVGLALCEKIIKLHDGEIHCKSDGKTGSTFSFIIPGFVGAIEDAPYTS